MLKERSGVSVNLYAQSWNSGLLNQSADSQRVGSVDDGKIEENGVGISSRLAAGPILLGIALTDLESNGVLLALGKLER